MTSTDEAGSGYAVREVEVPDRSIARFAPLIGSDRYAEFRSAAEGSAARLAGRTVWNINSTAAGGGVAEMLEVLVGYIRDAGIDIRWDVISGDAEFFAVTKRIHNRLHGAAGDDGDLAGPEAAHYGRVTAANAADVVRRIRPGDVVLLHDPQTAGMASSLVEAGARVVWRCHVGRDGTNEWTDEAWAFLRPHLAPCEAFIFSRRAYVPSWIDDALVHVIPPSIDPFSPKNQDMAEADVIAALGAVGIFGDVVGTGSATYLRNDGTPGRIGRRAAIVRDGPPITPDVPLVVQVSRWDHLKDMRGVMDGFATAVPGRCDAHLALVGPQMEAVTDDPEGLQVFAECLAAWDALPAAARSRVSLVSLPMDDVDENAAMVNALQRHATVVVQKSLREGFGLTVAEGMWKGRAVVASRVGGIIDQVSPGTGVLLDDPADLDAFGAVLVDLLGRPDEIAALGDRARRHVLDNFVGDRHLERYASLIEWLGT